MFSQGKGIKLSYIFHITNVGAEPHSFALKSDRNPWLGQDRKHQVPYQQQVRGFGVGGARSSLCLQ